MNYKIAKIFENKKPTNQYNLKEHDKTFTGRIQISKKIDEKWQNKSMSFVFFKNGDQDTVNFLKNYNGLSFGMECDLTLDKVPNSEGTYIKITLDKVPNSEDTYIKIIVKKIVVNQDNSF